MVIVKAGMAIVNATIPLTQEEDHENQSRKIIA